MHYGVQTMSTAKYAGRVYQTRLLDPNDGYTSTFTVNLAKDEIGSFFVFVNVDAYGYVSTKIGHDCCTM